MFDLMTKEIYNEKKENTSIWIPPRSEFIEPKSSMTHDWWIPPRSEFMKPKFSSKFHVDGYDMPWQTAPPPQHQQQQQQLPQF